MAGEHHPAPGTEADLADGVGPPWEHRLEIDSFETGLSHDRGEESGEFTFVAENTRDAAHLPNQFQRPVNIDVAQHWSSEPGVNDVHGDPIS
jgi:hypothetical protein